MPRGRPKKVKPEGVEAEKKTGQGEPGAFTTKDIEDLRRRGRMVEIYRLTSHLVVTCIEANKGNLVSAFRGDLDNAIKVATAVYDRTLGTLDPPIPQKPSGFVGLSAEDLQTLAEDDDGA